MKRSGWLCCVLLLALVGCQKFSLFRSQNADDDSEDDPKTVFIGDQVTVAGLYAIQIEGVGLVTGLDNTGGDPSPSLYRSLLLDDMRKRGVKNPNTLLQSPSTALVLVRAALPPVAQIGDTFDVDVVLPENTEGSSLNSGWLMETYLAEHAIVPGRAPLSGHVMAKAKGPVLIGAGESDQGSKASALKRGRVLGGGVYLGGNLHQERKLGLYLRNDYRNVRNAQRIAERVGARFNYYDHGLKRPLAKAMTDQQIELKIHPRYKENFTRYVQVIRSIALRETQIEQHDRIERLRKSLKVPQTAARSAMELEGIGPDTIPVLKEGLKHPSQEVRFYSADALAYLGDASGAAELAKVAEREEAFRVFALAALATLDGVAPEHLRDLMHETSQKPRAEVATAEPPEPARPLSAVTSVSTAAAPASTQPGSLKTSSRTTATTTTAGGAPEAEKPRPDEAAERRGAEVRYGAFHALWTLDKNDYFIRGQRVNGQFNLHVLETDGQPMIHLTRFRVPEIVLFGARQEFKTPLALSAGRHIMVSAPAGGGTVTLSRFEVGKPDEQRTVSTRVADVIRAAGELGASYPDVVQMLLQAKRQANAEGRLEVDALPQAGRIYYRPAEDLTTADAPSTRKTRVGRSGLLPNLFPSLSDGKKETNLEEDDDETDADSESAEPASGKSKKSPDKSDGESRKKSKDKEDGGETADKPGDRATRDKAEKSDQAEGSVADVRDADDDRPAKRGGVGRLRNPFRGLGSIGGQSEPDTGGRE